MRKLLTILIFLPFAQSALGQLQNLNKKWFYNIPNQLSSTEIRSFLLTDKRFVNRQSNDSLDLNRFFGATYLGSILSPEIPGSFNVDSSTIELTFGLGTVSVYKKKTKSYSGKFKILNLEYFISDSTEVSYLFDLARKDFESVSSKIDFTTYNSSSCFGDGITITYINNRNKFTKIELYKTFYQSGVIGLLIRYQANDK